MLSCGMHCALLEAGYFDHRLPSCCCARFSSFMQAFIDCASASPAVAVKSSLHVRVTSNTGTPSETATINCELKAIIGTEMGIVATPYPICSVRRYPKQYFMGKDGTRLCEIGPAAPTAPDHSCELGPDQALV